LGETKQINVSGGDKGKGIENDRRQCYRESRKVSPGRYHLSRDLNEVKYKVIKILRHECTRIIL